MNERRAKTDRRSEERRAEDRRGVDRRVWDRRGAGETTDGSIEEERRKAGRRTAERRADDRRDNDRRQGDRRTLAALEDGATSSPTTSFQNLATGQHLDFRGPGGNKTLTEITTQETVLLRELQSDWTAILDPLVRRFHAQVVEHFAQHIPHVRLLRATVECLSQPTDYMGRNGNDMVDVRLCAVCLCSLRARRRKEL